MKLEDIQDSLQDNKDSMLSNYKLIRVSFQKTINIRFAFVEGNHHAFRIYTHLLAKVVVKETNFFLDDIDVPYCINKKVHSSAPIDFITHDDKTNICK